MDTNQYLSVFIDEAKEHLQIMNQNLIELEENPEDRSILDGLFRVAHTIKGMAATMGYQDVADYTHKLENVLDSFRQGEKKVNSAIIDLLLEGADALETFIDKLAEGEQIELNFTGMQDRLEAAFKKANDSGQAVNHDATEEDQVEDIEPQSDNQEKIKVEVENPELDSDAILNLNQYEHALLIEAMSTGYNAFYIKVYFDSNVLLKGARAFMVFQKLESEGEIIKSKPEVEAIEDENFEDHFELIVVTQERAEDLKKTICQVSEIENVQVETLEASDTALNQDLEPEGTPQPDQDVSSEEEGVPDIGSTKTDQKVKTGKTVRVDIERLDKLMNLVSELVINKTRLEQVATSKENLGDLVKTSEQFSRITSEIQNVVMKVRMVPLDNVFNRFPRMVRDLSRSLNKEVNLVIEGKETELDRSLIDEIGDLLMHLIRNAIDHGLEDPKTREKFQKPAKGTLHINAYHNENNVVIEVSDDGKGIDPVKVREKVLSKGLIDRQQSEQIPDSEIIDYLFTPGFSTTDEVSEVSGRGVGLDVVKSKIENLGGRVELDSQVHQGTKFTMYLPLTLAIIQALMVNVGKEQYALPLASIEETTIVTPSDIEKVREQEVIRLRDTIVPLVNLHHILDVQGNGVYSEQEKFAIIVKKGDRKAGLIVDELIGQQEVVIKSLGSYLIDVKGFTGATILGDGRVALILDVNSMFF